MQRVLRASSYVAFAWFLVIFFYGLANFPDAPYKACESAYGYCGKTGYPRTEAEFRAQQTWERVLLFSSPFAFLAVGYFAWHRRKSQMKVTANTSLERTRER
jgi:hypothetical protein